VWVARQLYAGLPSCTEEGVLSRARVEVIRQETLATTARGIGLPRLLKIGPGERKENRQNHDSLLSDAFEAIIAALSLECGEAAMEAFLRAVLAAPLAAVIASPPAPDAKTRLQMRLQALGRGLPTYQTVEATGVGHDHHFVVDVLSAEGAALGRGEGPNKRIAQTAAARMALETLR
jgi:ribonuclease-3